MSEELIPEQSKWVKVELKVGDQVKVLRKMGKDDPGTEVTGIIERFMNIVRIRGERTALIKYDDGIEPYPHPLSQIRKLNLKSNSQ